MHIDLSDCYTCNCNEQIHNYLLTASIHKIIQKLSLKFVIPCHHSYILDISVPVSANVKIQLSL